MNLPTSPAFPVAAPAAPGGAGPLLRLEGVSKHFGAVRAIIDVHYPGIKQKLVAEALRIFYDMRKVPGLKKKPSTSELLDWLKLLMVEDIDDKVLRERDPTKLIPPLHGALLKNEQDIALFERLAFLARREGSGARPGQQ